MSSLRSMPPRSMSAPFFWTATMTSLACHLALATTVSKTAGAPAASMKTSVPGRGCPRALAACPCSSVSRAVTSSAAGPITASAPTAKAFSSRDGITSTTTTCSTPRSFSQIVAPGPMGPAPNTTTLSDGFAVLGEDGDAGAYLGLRDEQVLAHAAVPPAAADDPGRRALRVHHDPVAGLQPGDLGADLDDLTGRLMTEAERDQGAAGAEGRAAHVREEGVGPADSAGADPHEGVPRAGDGTLGLHHVDPVLRAGPDGLHRGHGCSRTASMVPSMCRTKLLTILSG